MPVHYDFDGDVLVLRMVGEYVPSDIRAALASALGAREASSVRGLLFDVRESTALAKRSAQDVRAMAGFLAGLAPEYGGRLALLASADFSFGLMRMGGADVDAAGVPVHAFRTRQAAIDWLRAARGP